jgi:hypothetical protein
MKTESDIRDIKRVKVRRRLLCTGGPKEGYPAGAVFGLPFPPGIVLELKLDRARIESGLGSLEIIEVTAAATDLKKEVVVVEADAEEFQGAVVTITNEADAGVDIDTIDGDESNVIDLTISDSIEPVECKQVALPEAPEVPELEEPEPEKSDTDNADSDIFRPGCLDGEVVKSNEIIKTKRQLRDYYLKRFGTKLDARYTIDRMIGQILSMEAGI